MCALVRLRLVKKLTRPTQNPSCLSRTGQAQTQRHLSFKTASVQKVKTEKLSNTIVTTFATAYQHFGNFW